MSRMSKSGSLGLLAAGLGALLFSLHTIHVQNRSVGSRLAEIAVKIANMQPDKMDQKYIERKIEMNRRDYEIPNGIITDSKLESYYKNGMKVYKMTSDNKKSNKRVLYMHGGGYINQPSPFHWWFLDKLVQETDLEFTIPIYPKTPEFSYERAYDALMDLYNDLQEENFDDLVFMGDSAGGGLALGFCQYLKEGKRPLPRDIILISPWLDITLQHPEMERYQKADPMLGTRNLKKNAQLWAGGLDPLDYKLSPMYGNLEGLPPISIFVGTREICYPDARDFAEMLKQQGRPYSYYEYHMMNHIFPVYPIKEAALARSQIADLLK